MTGSLLREKYDSTKVGKVGPEPKTFEEKESDISVYTLNSTWDSCPLTLIGLGVHYISSLHKFHFIVSYDTMRILNPCNRLLNPSSNQWYFLNILRCSENK